MWVVEAFMTLNSDCMMWKSTSSSGWEYLIVWEDLGSSPMYANCVLFNYYCFNNMFDHVLYDIMLEVY